MIARPTLDMTVGRTLVRFDAFLRRAGVVSVTDPTVRTVRLGDVTLEFDEPNRETADGIISTGGYEPETVTRVLSLLERGGTFVDLGANIGIFSVLAARVVGSTGKVFAFEPTPATAGVLRRNLAANAPTVPSVVVEMAVGRAPGRTRFALFQAGQGNSIALPNDKAIGLIEVEVTSLDAFFAQQGWPPVDVIKMDVEGQEVPTFEGMHELVARNASMRVIFEYHGGQLARTGTSGASLIAAARAAGFDSFEVLLRNRGRIDLPAEMHVLDALTKRAAFNILAWSSKA